MIDERAQACFAKWGLANGRAEIEKMFGGVGSTLKGITHHYASFNWVFSGGDIVVVEGASHGEHRDGPWHVEGNLPGAQAPNQATATKRRHPLPERPGRGVRAPGEPDYNL